MSVAIMYRQKIDFSSCAWMVGFPKFGHIYKGLFLKFELINVLGGHIANIMIYVACYRNTKPTQLQAPELFYIV